MNAFVKRSSLVLLLLSSADGFVTGGKQSAAPTPQTLFSTLGADEIMTQSFKLSEEEVNPIIRIGEGSKEKVINSFGLVTLAVSLVTGPVWVLAMMITDKICEMNEDLDPNRAFFDYTGKIWSRLWLTMANSYPTISGEVELIREGQGPCLYVANHASWLDIPLVCTILDPVFKFIAKSELENVPCIGQQLKGVRSVSSQSRAPSSRTAPNFTPSPYRAIIF